ncbi:MAG: proline dehydrogenase family protein [Methanoregulaceae archaeon]|nr:proline dehydrogenase family protein [Methanoregulaceae archaeon]
MVSAKQWSLPDMDRALEWAGVRNGEGISCTLHALGEYATSRAPVLAMAGQYRNLAESIHDLGLDANISIKSTSLGAIFDRELCLEMICDLASLANRKGIGFEIDMEGKGLVEASLSAAARCAAEGYRVTLALQAYLDRTGDDLSRLLAMDVAPRIVKGAYLGDTDDFEEIEDRFKALFITAEAIGKPFDVGTHDPGLIRWICRRMEERKELLRFGFLMGLSDRTKTRLVEEGWRVVEYVAFGRGGEAYTARREKYLSDLAKLRRKPAR